jgi:hypothetical protein
MKENPNYRKALYDGGMDQTMINKYNGVRASEPYEMRSKHTAKVSYSRGDLVQHPIKRKRYFLQNLGD